MTARRLFGQPSVSSRRLVGLYLRFARGAANPLGRAEPFILAVRFGTALGHFQ